MKLYADDPYTKQAENEVPSISWQIITGFPVLRNFVKFLIFIILVRVGVAVFENFIIFAIFVTLDGPSLQPLE